MLLGFGAEGAQRFNVEVLNLERRRLEDHLELMKLLRAVGVLAVTPVGRAARRLDEGDVPRLGAEGAEERGWVVGAGADLGVVRLHEQATTLRPELLKR